DHSASELRASELAVSAVGIALVFAQVQEETRCRTTAQDLVHHEYREVVRVFTLYAKIAELKNGLHGAWTVNQLNARSPLIGRSGNLRLRHVSLLPIAECLLKFRHDLFQSHVAYDCEHGVVGPVVS